MQSFAVLAALVLLSNSVKGGPRQALTPARRAHACAPGMEPAVGCLAWLACSPRCRPYFGQAADMLAAGRSNPPLSDVVFHAVASAGFLSSVPACPPVQAVVQWCPMASLNSEDPLLSFKDLLGHGPLTFSGLFGTGIWSQSLFFHSYDSDRP